MRGESGANARQGRWSRDVGVAGLTIAVLLVGACTRSNETQSMVTPSLEVPLVSSSPSLVASPTQPTGCGPNPIGVPTPNFVVGRLGLNGPGFFVESTRQFSLANNDTSEHRVDLFRLPDPTETMTWSRQDLLQVVRGGDWPSPGVRVIKGGPKISPMETWQACTVPLAVGFYALVDRGDDPRTGETFSQQLPYVRVIQVMPSA